MKIRLSMLKYLDIWDTLSGFKEALGSRQHVDVMDGSTAETGSLISRRAEREIWPSCASPQVPQKQTFISASPAFSGPAWTSPQFSVGLWFLGLHFYNPFITLFLYTVY